MKPETRNRIIRFIFIIYSAVMLWLLFGRTRTPANVDYLEMLRTNINLRPFATIGRYVRALMNGRYIQTSVINLFGNIILFVPLGCFLPAVFRRVRNFGLFLFFQTEIIVFIEIVQLFTLLGVCDIDDLILNTLGGVIGYAIFRLRFRKRNNLGK